MAVNTRVTQVNATLLLAATLCHVTQVNATLMQTSRQTHVTQVNATTFRTLRNQNTRVTQCNATTMYYLPPLATRRFIRIPRSPRSVQFTQQRPTLTIEL